MKRRLLAVLLWAAVLVGCFPVCAAADALPGEWSKPLAVLYAGSDFQYPNTTYKGKSYPDYYAAGAAVMEELLISIQRDYPTVDEALFLGDYEPSNYTAKSDGLDAVRQVLNQTWGLEDDRIHFLQGNHDQYDMPGLDGAQLVFTEDYTYQDKKGVGYVVTAERTHYHLCMIHEDAFPETWITDSAAVRQRKLQAVQETAAALQTHLTRTLQGSKKPVIVMGHLPLHYSRQDNIYARYLVDALNEGVQQGRNIIYLFGHNHSRGYDNYLGGSSVYYAPGTRLKVPDPQAAAQGAHDWEDVTFGFTYLNAGYVGYVGSNEPGAGLSSAIIEIYTDRVELRRYNHRGMTNLKNPGVANSGGVDLTLAPDASVIPSPQILPLSDLQVKVTDPVKEVLPPGGTDTLALQVTGARGNVQVRWESSNEAVASVSGSGLRVQVTGNRGGSATLRAKITDGTGVGVFHSLTVQVRHPQAVQLRDTPTQTVYRLVTDWTTVDSQGSYMILNTNSPGTATAFAGAAADGSRVKDGTLSQLTTAPQVFSIPWEDGSMVCTQNTHDYDQWQLQTWPHDNLSPEASYLLASGNKVFTGASNSFDPAVRGYADATGLYMGGNANSAGTIGWVLDPVNRQLLLHSYRIGGDSVGQFALRSGYGLYYDPLNDCFRLAQSGEPIYLYEKTQLDLSQIWLWIQGEGDVIAGCAADADTGARVVQLIQGQQGEIPLTLDMISGADLNTPGVYRCTVTAYGKVLTEDFLLTVWESEAATAIETLAVRNLYIPSTRLRMGKQYAFLSDQGSRVCALGMNSRPGLYRSLGCPAEMFLCDGVSYAAISDASCSWIATPTKPTRFRLENAAYGGYLGISKDRLTLDKTPKSLWTYGAMTLKEQSGMSSACSGGLFHATRKRSMLSLYQLVETDQLVTRGYLTATEGSVRAGDLGSVITPGGTLVVSERLSNSGAQISRKEIPITLAMLQGISLRDLMKPGTYTCSVWYGSAKVCDNYVLSVY